MTREEFLLLQEAMNWLKKVSIQSGSGFDRRFIASMVPEKPDALTEPQKEWVYRLVYKYRRQIPQVYDKCKNHPHCRSKELSAKEQHAEALREQIKANNELFKQQNTKA